MTQRPSTPSGTPDNRRSTDDRLQIILYAKSAERWPLLAALVRDLQSQPTRADFMSTSEPAITLASVEKTTMTVLILAVEQKEELLEVLNILSSVHDRIQSGLLRTIVVNGMNHPRVIALLKGKNAHEIVDLNTNLKALNHKIKNAHLLISQTHQRLQTHNVGTATVVGTDGTSRTRAAGRTETANAIQWEKPIEHPNDFWLIPSAKNLRNVVGRWLIDMLGPGPVAGTWEGTDFERLGEKGWVWKPRANADAALLPQAGRWIFFGRTPEFNWQKNLWVFVAKMPYLGFYPEGQKEATFVRIDSPAAGKIKVYENSETARAFLPKIQSSLEASLNHGSTDESKDGTASLTAGSDPTGLSSLESLPRAVLDPSVTHPRLAKPETQPPEGEGPTWHDHTQTVGFEFRPKDLRISRDGKIAKWRDALDAEGELGTRIGLGKIKQRGIASGATSFEKVLLDVFTAKRNGVVLPIRDPLQVLEVASEGAVFRFPQKGVGEGDRFTLRVHFRLASFEKKFELEWSAEALLTVDASGSLARGPFLGGDMKSLAEIVRVVAQRQIELKDFFRSAKGA